MIRHRYLVACLGRKSITLIASISSCRNHKGAYCQPCQGTQQVVALCYGFATSKEPELLGAPSFGPSELGNEGRKIIFLVVLGVTSLIRKYHFLCFWGFNSLLIRYLNHLGVSLQVQSSTVGGIWAPARPAPVSFV